MADLDNIKSILSATILSTKSSVTLEQCNRDYKELQGEWIPYKKLGFKSLEEFFESLSDFKLVKLSNGGYIVEAKKSNDIKHITDMVSKQKSSKVKGSKHHLQRPARNVRSERTWKPAPSFGYHKTPPKVSSVYKKPKTSNNNYPSVSNRINKVPQAAPNITSQQPQSQQQTLPTRSINQPVKAPTSSAVAKKVLSSQNSMPNLVESGNTPTSKLSGIKPGDILARSLSNSNNNMGMNKEDKKESTVPSQVLQSNVKSRAANRLTALQNTLQTIEPEFDPIVKNTLPKAMLMKKADPIITLDSLDSKLKGLSDNKNRLMKCCEIMKLPQPVIKTVPIKQKRGNLYDCTIKTCVASQDEPMIGTSSVHESMVPPLNVETSKVNNPGKRRKKKKSAKKRQSANNIENEVANFMDMKKIEHQYKLKAIDEEYKANKNLNEVIALQKEYWEIKLRQLKIKKME